MVNTFDYQVQHPGAFIPPIEKDIVFQYHKNPQLEKNINPYPQFNKIIFILNGNKIIYRQDKSWLLTRGKMFLIKKIVYHRQRVYETGLEVLCFYFSDHILQEALNENYPVFSLKKNLATTPDMLIEINLDEATSAIFNKFISYNAQANQPGETLLKNRFRECLFYFLSNPANEAFLAYAMSIGNRKQTLVREIMESNFTCNLSLVEYARLTHRSLATFKREFGAIYQTSPGKWIAEKKLDYAQSLLKTTAKKVNEVAYECGFENVTHFSRVFKERFGLAPLQFRKK